ncbi:MAG: hypothetical protein CL607_27800 [Anaerolineaceae bacterium]|nr:hypothetical protein [Anaerolineaceae bacterium]
MTNDIDSIMQETRRYWYEDGFAEIAIGALFGLLSIVLIAQDVFRDRPEWLVTSIIGVTIITAFGGFVVRWIINNLKARVTYPRTGYVEYDDKPDPRAKRIALAMPLVIGLGIIIVPNGFAAMGGAVGVVMGAFMAFIAYQTGISRFTVASIVAIASGILSSYLGFNDVISTAIVFGSVSMSVFIGGSFTLMAYLRDHPTINEDE